MYPNILLLAACVFISGTIYASHISVTQTTTTIDDLIELLDNKRNGFLDKEHVENKDLIEYVKTALVKQPELLNQKSSAGATLLTQAIAWQRFGLVRYLITRGADTTITNQAKQTPLFLLGEYKKYHTGKSKHTSRSPEKRELSEFVVATITDIMQLIEATAKERAAN